MCINGLYINGYIYLYMDLPINGEIPLANIQKTMENHHAIVMGK